MSFELTRSTQITSEAAQQLVTSISPCLSKGTVEIVKGWMGGVNAIRVKWSDDFGAIQSADIAYVANTHGFTLPNQIIKLVKPESMDAFKAAFVAAGFTNANEIQIVSGGARRKSKTAKKAKAKTAKKSKKSSKKSKKSKKSAKKSKKSKSSKKH
jgi:hypothetical protein